MKQRLGKGLGALIPGLSVNDQKYQEILIEKIYPNPFQPREDFDEEMIDELSLSIKENGVIQPVIVREFEKGYELISGERRWRASIKAGFKTIPAVILDVDDESSVKYAIIENIQREDLNVIEIARAFKMLSVNFGYTQQQISESVGKDRSTVSNYLRLLSLPEKILNHVSRGTLSAGHIRCLVTLEKDEEKTDFAMRILKNGWSVRKTEEEIKKYKDGRNSSKTRRDDQILYYEKKLQDIINHPIRCRRKGNSIEICIKMESEDDVSNFLTFIEKPY